MRICVNGPRRTLRAFIVSAESAGLPRIRITLGRWTKAHIRGVSRQGGVGLIDGQFWLGYW